MKRGLVLAALVAAAISGPSPDAHAAADWTTAGRLPLRIFTDRDGLPQNAVTAIAFAEDGALWIGTKDGAARYNGRVWTSVSMPPECPSNWINALIRSADGSLWFATRGGGVARLKEGVWSTFSRSRGLPSEEVLALGESATIDAVPAILAGTAEGLARFDGERFVPVPLPEGSPSRRVTAFFEKRAEGAGAGLWIGLRDGILRLHRGKWTVFDLAKSGIEPNNPIRGFALTSAWDGVERMYAGVTHPGVLRLEGDRWVERNMRAELGMTHALLTTVERDGRESLWIAGQRKLARIHDGAIQFFDSTSGFPSQGFWSLAATPEGGGERGLWIGMAGAGLARLQHDGWTTFDAPRWLRDSSVYSLLETVDPSGEPTIWIGTNRGGLARMTPRESKVYEGREKAGSDTVLSLIETRSPSSGSVIWSGTTAGLGRLKDGRWLKVPLGDWTGATINALLASPRAGAEPAVYIGAGDGVGVLENGSFRQLSDEIGLPDPRVNALLETTKPDGARVLWVGTEKGLVRRDGNASTLFSTRNGLPADAVISLLEAREGRRHWIWIGTREGAARIDLDATVSEPPVTVFSTRSAPSLPNDTIYQIRQDRQGRMYLFTNKGIARLTPRVKSDDDPAEYDAYVFSTADGLPSAECNTGASMVDSQGRIWAGTIAGAAVLDPKNSVMSPPKPLRIERAVLTRTGAPLRSGQELAHDESHVTFEFALMSFFRDEDTHYRTELAGLDREPSAWTTDAKKEFTSLPEGHYTFNVWARDVSGLVTGPRQFAFSVKPAPWRTWSALFLYAATLALLFGAGVRMRLRAARRRNEELEGVVRARTAELADAVRKLQDSEQAALQAKDAALEASRAKSTFLANMSHELRTPLNAVIGFAQVLERRASLKGEDKENLRIIQRSGEHLLSLINDVLSLSKIEAGGLVLNVRPFDLQGLVESVRSIIAPRADSKGLALVFDIDPALGPFVSGDEAKLRQVLINLLGNAVKFTARGRVRLSVQARGERTLFSVSDTGPGIAESELAGLFGAFVQTETGRASKEGTGLGLAISRQIVRLMGGDLEVQSRVGEGAEFLFEIVLERAAEGPAPSDDRRVAGLAAGEARRRILVVDDIAANRVLLCQLLRAVDFEVREAASGAAALDAVESWRPAVVFMDVRMAGMDGRETTRLLREREAQSMSPRTPVIALSAGAFEHEREEMMAAGADDFVAKPFRAEEIFAAITRCTGVLYRYEVEAPRRETPADPVVLSPARLSAIPEGKRRALHEALLDGDVSAAKTAARSIAEEDPELGEAVLTEVQAFRLERVLALLEGQPS